MTDMLHFTIPNSFQATVADVGTEAIHFTAGQDVIDAVRAKDGEGKPIGVHVVVRRDYAWDAKPGDVITLTMTENLSEVPNQTKPIPYLGNSTVRACADVVVRFAREDASGRTVHHERQEIRGFLSAEKVEPSQDPAFAAAAAFLLSESYRPLLLRAIASRLATTSKHFDEHRKALELVEAYDETVPKA